MYRTKLLLLAVLVIGASLLVVQVASAVGMHRGGVGPGMMSMDKLTKALNLTPDQVSKIQAIQQSAQAQRQAIVADKSLTPDVRRSKLMDLRESTHSQVMAVLTPDQQAKLKQLHEAKRAERMQKMSAALNLTPDQQAQIKAIRDTEKSDIKAVRSDNTLSAADRQAKIKDIRVAAREKIRGLLTPEQLSKLDAMKKSRAGVGAGPRKGCMFQ